MTVVRKQIGTLLLLASCATAQNTPAGTTVQDVKIVRDGSDVLVEVTLSAPVKASVIIAKNPDRLVLELPNATLGEKQQRFPVNYGGIRAVRIGLHSAAPAVTHLVVDLDQPHLYVLRTNGNRITLTVSPAVSSRSRQGAPAPAVFGGLIGIFRRRQPLPPPPVVTDNSAPMAPPPSDAPIAFPEDHSASSATSTSATASSHATAAHPNRASLQEGTVFPSLGSPGAGIVPGQSGANAGKSDSGVVASQPNPTGTPQGDVFPASTAVANSPAPAAVVPATQPAAASVSHESTPSAPTAASATALPKAEAAPAALPAPVASSPSASNPPVASSSTQMTATSPPSPVTSVPQAQSSSSSSQVSAKEPAGQGAPAVAKVEPMQAPPVAQSSDTKVSPDAVAGETGADASLPVLAVRAVDPNLRTVFKVKYVAEGVAYLDGGRSSGLAEGMKLEIKDTDLPVQQGATVDPTDPRVVAELEVTALAETSAITDIHLPKRQVKTGDLAYLSSGDAETLVQQRALSTTRKYPAVVTFTEGDPLEEEARAEVPRPPLPSVNRARGRIGFDYMGTVSHGTSGMTNSDLGMVLRADITRINGTYWNLSGFWRGRLAARSSTGQQTLQDLINRTYHLSMTYDNPNSAWVAGFGRLYLPWAASLDTIDGGYFGRRIAPGTTAGVFAGSTPDPTSWDFNVDRHIGGVFVNFEGGSFDAFRYTSTSGVGVSTLKWQIDRPFVFFENSLFYKRYLSIYDSLQADSPRGNTAVPAPGPGLSRNFLSVRIQPHPRVELDFNHNYFRDIPTFDPQLVGTGLLDKYLFQGFSVGARVEVAKQIWVYTDLGRSNRTGDAKTSLNQMYGVTFGHLPWLGLRADAHYSRFNSSFGAGSYRSFSLSRTFSDSLRLEILGGEQSFSSLLSSNNRARFVTSNVDFSFGTNYFVQGGFTVNRGQFSYDQWMFTLGYRFDSKSKHQ